MFALPGTFPVRVQAHGPSHQSDSRPTWALKQGSRDLIQVVAGWSSGSKVKILVATAWWSGSGTQYLLVVMLTQAKKSHIYQKWPEQCPHQTDSVACCQLGSWLLTILHGSTASPGTLWASQHPPHNPFPFYVKSVSSFILDWYKDSIK